jgi:hypothetical protein
VWTPDKNLNIDESMVGYKGHLSFKQYMPAKRTRFGIKNWALNESETGYALKLTPYTGKQNDAVAQGVGLSSRVVKGLLDGYQNKGHHVYMDNFYSSPDLFDTLKSDGIGACGTVRANRKELPVAFKQKMAKGDPIRFERRGALLATQFHDKKVVQGLSTIHTAESSNKRVRCKGGFRDVKKPKLIGDYNAYMGGTDKMDQLCSYYEYSHRSNKWYMPVFHAEREICLANAYTVYCHEMQREGLKVLDSLEFRIEVVDGLLQDHQVEVTAEYDGGDVPDWFRLSGRHFPELYPRNYRPHCVVCSDRSKGQRHQTSFYCKQCKQAMCPAKCFERYHTLKDFTIKY